ncbi:hypothetical protein ACVMGE_006695 [Bradyrhizobium diazoefficiens]
MSDFAAGNPVDNAAPFDPASVGTALKKEG